MKKDEAINLLEKTFNNQFDENQYIVFIKNFLKDIDESDNFSYSGAYIPDDYKEYVKSYKRIGKFVSYNDTELDLIIVNLKKESLLERNRTMQRNFIAKYLRKRGDKDFSLVAYYTEDSSDWRFSFIKKEYTSEINDKGTIKAKEHFTPAKRFSFLVGENEPNHTAKKQLLPILQLDSKPTFEVIEKAFNIESVTNEFFEKYKNLFLILLEEIENIIKTDIKVKTEFETKNINTANFAKKLLGQIVFLYFIQKKGWLGIEKDENGNFRQWGSGAKNFLKRLFEGSYCTYDNFFNDILEPLFYEALANERENDYYHQLKCKIPFLNGGLFEPIGNYNWQEVKIPIREIFFKEVFETFDLYNFTVREDEPLEKEVAVDPEMLGKVFENLLEVKDRKSKGAFYTPREIVHYMCQESLINYIDTEINQVEVAVIKEKPKQESFFPTDQPEQLPLIAKEYNEIIQRKDIEAFIKNGDSYIYNDSAVNKGTKSYKYSISESIRKNAKLIDEKLANVKICDPSIGSGAFPVGIMTEIVKARDILSVYITDTDEEERSLYNFKRNAIQKSIYGVDIDPSAVDISKLRLWLSLIVDENEYKDIKPLPNLDYKIMCGNSLLRIIINAFNYKLFDELENLKPKFFNETNNKKKKILKKQIDDLINQITNNNKDFDFKIYFSEVFDKGHGFDIIIGNPPYLRIQGIKEYDSKLADSYKNLFKSATGSYDLYVLFVEKGMELLKSSATLNYIMPHKWVNSGFGKGLREIISKGKYLDKFISFGEYKVFNASTYTSIIGFTKEINEHLRYYEFNKNIDSNIELEKSLNNLNESNFNKIKSENLNKEVWILTDNKIGKVIDKILNNQLKIKDVFSKIFQGIATSKDSVYFLKDCIDKGNLIEGYSEELKKNVLIEKELLKPLLKGNQVHKYENIKTSNYVLFPYRIIRNIFDIKAELLSYKEIEINFPNALIYLNECKNILKNREKNSFNDNDWYRYGRSQGITYEGIEKLVSPDISMGGNFTYDQKGEFYSTTTVYGYIKNENIKLSYKFLISILNSNVLWFYLKNTGNVMSGGYFRYKPAYLNDFSVPLITEDKQKPFEIIVDYILFLKKVNLETTKQKLMPVYFEQILNGMVYELYFEEALKKSEKDILKYLDALKDINDYKTDEEKLSVITSQFNILDNIQHPVRNNLFFMDSIDEIIIIEGKNK